MGYLPFLRFGFGRGFAPTFISLSPGIALSATWVLSRRAPFLFLPTITFPVISVEGGGEGVEDAGEAAVGAGVLSGSSSAFTGPAVTSSFVTLNFRRRSQ